MSAPPADRRAGRHRVLVSVAFTGGLVLLALPIVRSDGAELLRVASGIQPELFALPIGFMLLSYAAMSRSYQGIAEAADCHLRFRDWLRITFVSNTVNYLVTSAGLSGFAVRMYLLGQHGVPPGRAVLISLVQTFLTNFTLLFFILIGFATVVIRNEMLPPAVVAAASVAVVIFTAVLAYALVLVYHRRMRRRTLLFVANTIHRVLRRVRPQWTPGRVRLWRYLHNLNRGLEFLLSRKERMIAPACWIMLDWCFMVGILWTAFRVVNYPVEMRTVIVGFAIGVGLSLVPLVPAGLGIMDYSMTGIFHSMGVPWEPATVAVLIFRVTYYLLPLLTSLFLFHSVMRQATRIAGRAESAPPAI